MLPTLTGEMRVGTDPELRFTPAGMPICSFRAVASSRKKDEQTGEWADDKTSWVTVTTFQQMAENVAESIQKGDLIALIGRLEVQEWTDQENNKRITVNVIADAIGPALRWATAKVTQAQRSNGQSAPPQQQQRSQQRPPQQQSRSGGDPWATPQSEDPPF
jgi:single-strand DNA-binding protein